MVNILLFIIISLFFLYLFYDQFGMYRIKGQNKLKVRLKKQAKIDAVIFIGLLVLLIFYTQKVVSFQTVFLLATLIALTVYGGFLRSPVLLLKQYGFFYGNIYFLYTAIEQINLAEEQILVIDLKSGRRLLVHIESSEDLQKIVDFFGGMKDSDNTKII
ncbi:DUF986 family protein [Rodentibacter caecimuris]|uniref:UPF0266 membrane protein BKG89_03235 n=1 Tax=Rodentibacter caecimuris TaxID=1796644 RepID=A0ABX3KYP4_9PAST|nr:hypothetical protein BKG89_03235 [Rodentibacter heylii]